MTMTDSVAHEKRVGMKSQDQRHAHLETMSFEPSSTSQEQGFRPRDLKLKRLMPLRLAGGGFKGYPL